MLVALPFASLWVVDGTGIGVLWRALAVAGLLALVLRIGAELDPPSVFAPAVAYTTDSRACPAKLAKEGGVPARCITAGFLLGQTEDSVLLAATPKRAFDIRQVAATGALTGIVVRLPTRSLVAADRSAPASKPRARRARSVALRAPWRC